MTIATKAGECSGDCDLIVTATSAFGQRVIDITKCKPGAVICDVARPPDINAAEAALRPDVLVIESGEVLIPGDIDFGYDIGLPPKTSYACLAETALLAMEGRFEDYTLGRNIEIERVKEIYRLFKKHQFKIAGLRSFGKYITDEDVAKKRKLAEELRANPEKFAKVKAEAAAKLEKIRSVRQRCQRKPTLAAALDGVSCRARCGGIAGRCGAPQASPASRCLKLGPCATGRSPFAHMVQSLYELADLLQFALEVSRELFLGFDQTGDLGQFCFGIVGIQRFFRLLLLSR